MSQVIWEGYALRRDRIEKQRLDFALAKARESRCEIDGCYARKVETAMCKKHLKEFQQNPRMLLRSKSNGKLELIVVDTNVKVD